MNPVWQDAIKEAFASAPSSKHILDTLEISQVGVQSTVYIVKSRLGITAYVEEDSDPHYFEPVGFQFRLPPGNEEGFRSLDISIDNVSQRVLSFIETARTTAVPVLVTYRPYMSDDLSAPQMSPPLVLVLKDIQITPFQVVGRATFMDLVNKPFPSKLYTREQFPSLG